MSSSAARAPAWANFAEASREEPRASAATFARALPFPPTARGGEAQDTVAASVGSKHSNWSGSYMDERTNSVRLQHYTGSAAASSTVAKLLSRTDCRAKSSRHSYKAALPTCPVTKNGINTLATRSQLQDILAGRNRGWPGEGEADSSTNRLPSGHHSQAERRTLVINWIEIAGPEEVQHRPWSSRDETPPGLSWAEHEK